MIKITYIKDIYAALLWVSFYHNLEEFCFIDRYDLYDNISFYGSDRNNCKADRKTDGLLYKYFNEYRGG